MFGVIYGPSISGSKPLALMSASQRRSIVSRVLLATDVVACAVTFGIAEYLDAADALMPHLQLVAGEVVIAVSIYAIAMLYSGHGRSGFERLRARTIATALICAVLFTVKAVSGSVDLIGSIMLMPPLLLLTHYAELAAVTWLDRRGLWAERALLLGPPERLEPLARELRARAVFALDPVAILDAAPQRREPRAAQVSGLPVISDPGSLRSLIDVVISAGDCSPQRLKDLAAALDCRTILVLPDGTEGASLWASTRAVGSGIGIEQSRGAAASEVIRRAVDIVAVVILAVPVGLIVGIAAAAVKYIDRGPAFYVQRRVGKDGCEFGVVKIRSMYCDSERRLANHLAANPRARREWETRFKLTDDPRILPVVGNFIRRSSIDELPQLWNVLRGDMNLVGPRPFPQYHIKMFDEEFRVLRTSVRPGVTGLWQVSTRSKGDLDAQKADDVFYIRNRSLWMDFYILLQTVPAVMSGSGAH